jgi:hypothetical protein
VSSAGEWFRRTYVEHVTENPRAQDNLLASRRLLLRSLARVRANVPRLSRGPLDNLFHAGLQKTGSQWIKDVFSDPRLRRFTGLWVYPQHRYEWTEFHRRFPRRHFVPGLYLSYDHYQEIRKPPRYRTFYVVRDPRDLVVSWYFSVKESHRLAGQVPHHRARVQALDLDEGIAFAIRTLSLKLAFARSWILHGSTDDHVLIMRFEDMAKDPVAFVRRIIDHAGFVIPDSALVTILADYTKEKVREREEARSFLTRRAAPGLTNYRKEPKSWREVMNEKHHALFRSLNGDLVALLGYE